MTFSATNTFMGIAPGFLLLVSGALLSQQFGGLAIDRSRPFVQITFDHAGPRTPLSKFESPTGLWLRLVNNSRVPISVLSFDPGTADPGIGVADEVLLAHFSDATSDTPDQSADGGRSIAPGKGYVRDVGSPAIIAPGRDLLFSVPISHVGPTWFLRVQFQFDLPPVKSGRQPYSFVDFTWSDVPSRARGLWNHPPVNRDG